MQRFRTNLSPLELRENAYPERLGCHNVVDGLHNTPSAGCKVANEVEDSRTILVLTKISMDNTKWLDDITSVRYLHVSQSQHGRLAIHLYFKYYLTGDASRPRHDVKCSSLMKRERGFSVLLRTAETIVICDSVA